MIKFLLTSVVVLFFSAQIFGQSNIKVDIKNYESDTLILGYYLADKLLVKDSVVRDNAGLFTYTQDSLMEPGMYIVVSIPEGMFYQILVGEAEEEQKFSVVIDTLSPQEISFEGSKENEIFYNYLNFINTSRAETSKLDQAIMGTDSVMVSIREQLIQDKALVERIVSQKQQTLIADHPESIAAILVKSNLPFEFPVFEGTAEEIQSQKYKYYKKRYFDNVDLNHNAILRTPVIHQRINYYMENLTPIDPDSIILSVDHLLGSMDQDSEIYRYYLSYFLNKYGNSKYIGLDKVYVHLALNYYGKDKAPWVTEENKMEIVSNAKKIEPILIGKPAPDFTIYKEDGSELSLSDLNKDYTILVFWKPNCGHCTKAMPHIIDFNEKYKDKGVEVVTICTQGGKDFGKCWEDVKKKGMEGLINAGDQYGKSRILSKYYANSTPKIFILDKDKRIKLKKVPAENLDAVMQQIMGNEGAAKSAGE